MIWLSRRGAKRREILEIGLSGVANMPFDNAAARHAAKVRVELEALGSKIGPLDILIAGTALSRDAVLVTNNTREFSRVKNLCLEDWRIPEHGLSK